MCAVIVQELRESGGGRPGLSVLTSILVSVYIEPCFGIGHSLSLICQPTSEDIKHHFIISVQSAFGSAHSQLVLFTVSIQFRLFCSQSVFSSICFAHSQYSIQVVLLTVSIQFSLFCSQSVFSAVCFAHIQCSIQFVLLTVSIQFRLFCSQSLVSSVCFVHSQYSVQFVLFSQYSVVVVLFAHCQYSVQFVLLTVSIQFSLFCSQSVFS